MGAFRPSRRVALPLHPFDAPNDLFYCISRLYNRLDQMRQKSRSALKVTAGAVA